MNIIKVNIDFEQGICQNKGISVVTGDYNSTKVVFDFTENGEEESAATRKVFEMKNPSGELVYVDEIVNNEVILVGEEDNTMYSLFGEAGDYTFEVSLYGEDSKLTSVCGYITAKEEQVIVDGEVVETQITLFDNLMQELVQNIGYVENLNVEAEKVEHTTTITITRKDGTSYDVEVLDGETPDLNDYYTKEETYSKAEVDNLIPTKTSDLTNDSDYTTKTYVDSLVGDIETILTTLDVGSGVNGN